MDSFRMIMFLLINMITLDINLAEHKPFVRGSTMLRDVRRFSWSDLNGKAVARSEQQRKSDLGESDLENNTAQPRGVYWIPTTCDSMLERGYTCLACGESLHCMGGGFALKAICGGFRPFCYNGVCSSTRGEKCNKNEELVAAAAVEPTRVNATAVGGEQEPAVHKLPGEETSIVEESVVEEKLPGIQEPAGV